MNHIFASFLRMSNSYRKKSGKIFDGDPCENNFIPFGSIYFFRLKSNGLSLKLGYGNRVSDHSSKSRRCFPCKKKMQNRRQLKLGKVNISLRSEGLLRKGSIKICIELLRTHPTLFPHSNKLEMYAF